MKLKAIYFLLITYMSIVSVITAASEYNVKDYGATGNGISLDTKSIQRAIDKASKSGGGIVVIPSGIYKTGTLFLKDNINLHLQEGAKLLGSSDINDYTEITYNVDSRTNKLYVKYAVVFADGAKNISITGPGIIDGNGLNNFQITRPQNERPFLVRLVNCKNVKIKDVQLLESANWTLHLLNCSEVTVDGVEIINTTRANRDGLDIDACKDVFVSNCKISSQDDAIVMKATNNTVCENITITNCILTSHASAIKTGTESNGGFKNITVSNCIIKNIPIHAGFEFMTVDGGNLENITVSNIVMDSVATPIYVYLGNRARPYKAKQYVTKVSKVKNIRFNNIAVTNAKLPCGVVGINNRKVNDVSFNNVSIYYSEALSTSPLPVNNVPYKDMSYPMAKMHGTNLPAYAFYCRNVDGLSFNNVAVYSAKGEKRPAFLFDKTNNLEINNAKSFGDNFSSVLGYLRNTSDVYLTFCRTLNTTGTLFKIEKQNCSGINLGSNFLQEGEKELKEVKSLPEKIKYADISPEAKYDVKNGEMVDGLPALKISDKPLVVEFDISEHITPQICLLIKNNSDKHEKVKIKYNGIEQEFCIDWNEWGWAPISLTKQFDKAEKVKFQIEPVDSNSGLVISKVYLKSLKLGYTD